MLYVMLVLNQVQDLAVVLILRFSGFFFRAKHTDRLHLLVEIDHGPYIPSTALSTITVGPLGFERLVMWIIGAIRLLLVIGDLGLFTMLGLVREDCQPPVAVVLVDHTCKGLAGDSNSHTHFTKIIDPHLLSGNSVLPVVESSGATPSTRPNHISKKIVLPPFGEGLVRVLAGRRGQIEVINALNFVHGGQILVLNPPFLQSETRH